MNIPQIRPAIPAVVARHRVQQRPVAWASLVLSMADTCTGIGMQHRVLVDIAARYQRSGRYPALCGVEVAAASLTTPAVDDCRDCAARVRQSVAVSDRTPGRSLLRWLRGSRPAHRRTAR